MTHDEIDVLEAGREMDALVAERVMKTWTKDEGWQGGGYVESRTKRSVVRSGPPPCSTDIAAALLVVEKVATETGRSFGVLRLFHREGDWLAYTYESDVGGVDVEAEADTAPLAICRAALKAVA